MADDIAPAGVDPREEAGRRRRLGEERRARRTALVPTGQAEAGGGGSGGGGGGRSLVPAGSSDPVPQGGRSLATRGANAVGDVADRRIPLSLGQSVPGAAAAAGRVLSRAIPVVGTAADVLRANPAGQDRAEFERVRDAEAARQRESRPAYPMSDMSGPDETANARSRDGSPGPAPAPRQPPPRPQATRGNGGGRRELTADDLNGMVLDRLGKPYEGARPPEGPDASIARARIDQAMGMKRGGMVKPVKKMAKGGMVKAPTRSRGDGCASRGKTKGRFC